MENFKKYIPQNLFLSLQAIVIWFIAGHYDRKELQSYEALFLWFVFTVLSYALIEGAKPKENKP